MLNHCYSLTRCMSFRAYRTWWSYTWNGIATGESRTVNNHVFIHVTDKDRPYPKWSWRSSFSNIRYTTLTTWYLHMMVAYRLTRTIQLSKFYMSTQQTQQTVSCLPSKTSVRPISFLNATDFKPAYLNWEFDSSLK